MKTDVHTRVLHPIQREVQWMFVFVCESAVEMQ